MLGNKGQLFEKAGAVVDTSSTGEEDVWTMVDSLFSMITGSWPDIDPFRLCVPPLFVDG